MDEKLASKKINELAEEYAFSENTVRKYYNILMEYPFIKIDEDYEKVLNCLETIVQDRFSHKEDMGLDSEYRRSVNETICDTVYRAYGDTALHFLNRSFLRLHDINETEYDREKVYEKDYRPEEKEYHGYDLDDDE